MDGLFKEECEHAMSKAIQAAVVSVLNIFFPCLKEGKKVSYRTGKYVGIAVYKLKECDRMSEVYALYLASR